MFNTIVHSEACLIRSYIAIIRIQTKLGDQLRIKVYIKVLYIMKLYFILQISHFKVKVHKISNLFLESSTKIISFVTDPCCIFVVVYIIHTPYVRMYTYIRMYI